MIYWNGCPEMAGCKCVESRKPTNAPIIQWGNSGNAAIVNRWWSSNAEHWFDCHICYTNIV